MDGISASGSTLIGSTLESVGYYYQAYFLDVFAGPFQTSIGMMFYVVGAVMAISTFAITGKYKFGLWFLLAPGLFFGAVLHRTEIEPADWRFGGRAVIVDAAAHSVCETIDNQTVLSGYDTSNCADNPPTANVSSVFAWFNQLISYSTQQITYVLVQGRQRAMDHALVRAELIAATKAAPIHDPGIRELFHKALMFDCKDVMGYAAIARGTDRTAAQRDDAHTKMVTLLERHRVELTDGALTYVARLAIDYPALFDLFLQAGDHTRTIAQLHQLIDNKEASTRLTDTMSPREIDAAVKEFKDNSENRMYTCSEVWSLAYMGIHESSRQAVRHLQTAAGERLIHKQAILCDLKKLTVPYDTDAATDDNCLSSHTDTPFSEGEPDAPLLLYGAIARHIMRNELLGPDAASAAFQKAAKRSKEFNRVQSPNTVDSAKAEAILQESQETSFRSQLHTTASAMPYYQGLALFFLGIMYPFFALGLLIPGKHAMFLRWFQLWVWVKSWDLGFAIVMYLDQILFNLFTTANTPWGADAAPRQLEPDLGQVMFSLRELDPSFDLGSYYYVISSMLVSIPPLMGQVVLGAIGGGGQMISGTLGNYAEYFGQGQGKLRGGLGVMQNRLSAVEHAGQQAHKMVDNAFKTGGQLPGASNNRVSDTTGLNPGGLGYEMGGHSLNLPGGSSFKNLSAEDMKNAAIYSAAGQGITQGMTGIASELAGFVPGVGSDLARMSTFGVMKDVAVAPLKGLQGGAGQVRNFSMQGLTTSLKYATSKGVWDGINSQKVQGVHSARGRMYGALEIPFVAMDDAFFEDYQLRKMENLDYWVQLFKFGAGSVGKSVVGGGSNDSSITGDMARKVSLLSVLGLANHFASKMGQTEEDDYNEVYDNKLQSLSSDAPSSANAHGRAPDAKEYSRERLTKALLYRLSPNNPVAIELREMLGGGSMTDGDIAFRFSEALNWEKRNKKDEGGKEDDVTPLD